MLQSRLLAQYTHIKHYFLEKDEKKEDFGIRVSISMKQTHSTLVKVITDSDRQVVDSDGLITVKQIFLEVKTADCLPILFFDPVIQVSAIIHAGWKGLLAGIVSETVLKMQNLGSLPKNIKLAIGPHIGVCCYDVPRSRVNKFSSKIANFSYSNIHKERGGKNYLDLAGYALLQLVQNGLLHQNIDILKVCTKCDSRFNSYRRDGKNCGRMISIIGIQD